MNDDVRNIVLGLVASGISAAAGWFVRTQLWRRQLRRKRAFFGLSMGSECLLVVNQDPTASGWGVARHDAFALLEISALIKECGAHADIVVHDAARQGIGVRTEFCVGGPVSNRRTEAHLRSLLPGVDVNTVHESPDEGAFTVGGETYRMDKGTAEYALLARLAGPGGSRPVFLVSGQRSVTNQAAIRYLAQHHTRLARQHGLDGTFCLLLKVVNSDAYGPDMVELVADVTAAATAR
ncbi:hypothetical protein [Streptomyces roseoverticillatus]|uniref:hypothetical protein n=1 Tax=Streptomyces roseoverticillatus TaxID=66429 RepID=UPI0004C04532|nr:hypothetical protein [Streptomyces roseoverticillatus]